MMLMPYINKIAGIFIFPVNSHTGMNPVRAGNRDTIYGPGLFVLLLVKITVIVY